MDMTNQRNSFIAGIIRTATFGCLLWVFWTCGHVGEKFFGFLPSYWQHISFADCINLTFCLSIIRCIIFPRMSITNNMHVKVKHGDSESTMDSCTP